jgi:hypothetical protein
VSHAPRIRSLPAFVNTPQRPDGRFGADPPWQYADPGFTLDRTCAIIGGVTDPDAPTPRDSWKVRIEQLHHQREAALAELEDVRAKAAQALLAAQADIAARLETGVLGRQEAVTELERAGQAAIDRVNDAHRAAGLRIGEIDDTPEDPS